jgi:dTDP-4-amino-4,6-dideoxygalactose transaminase
LDDIISRRRRNVAIYQDMLRAKQVYIPPVRSHEVHSYVMFIAQAENRDELKAHLEKRGVQSLVYYGTPLHLHPAARKFGFKRGDFPVAERQADRVLALPHHQHLTPKQIAHAASAVNEFYGA